MGVRWVRVAPSSSFSGDGLNWRSFVIAARGRFRIQKQGRVLKKNIFLPCDVLRNPERDSQFSKVCKIAQSEDCAIL
jgi:hypothetical protein